VEAARREAGGSDAADTSREGTPREPSDIADVPANGLTAAEQNLVVCLERYAPDFVARMRAGAAEPEVIGFGEPDDR
jgi:hypothetical protein